MILHHPYNERIDLPKTNPSSFASYKCQNLSPISTPPKEEEKKTTLGEAMDWKIVFYRRYFADISDIGWPLKDIEHQLSKTRNIRKIGEKNEREATHRVAEEAYQNIKDISAIYRIYLPIYRIYLGNIGDFFESFFKKNIYPFFTF